MKNINFNPTRKLVSGTRRRIEDDILGLDIDLTYICLGRIIVMSYPASGFVESKYRNKYEDVRY